MRHLALSLATAIVATSLAGCLVRTREPAPHHHHHGRARPRECPPAYHWERGRCVHNGRGKHHR